MAPIETRSKKRKPVEALAEFIVSETNEKTVKLNVPKAEPIKSLLLDISVTGCGLDSPYLVPPGVVLEVKINTAPFAEALKIDRKDPIASHAVVRSCMMRSQGHYRLGVRFSNIKEEDRDLIDRFISAKEQRGSPRWPMQ